MKGTRTLLSLAVGLALASSGAHAAFVCPSDPAQLTPIPTIQGTGSGSALATQTVTDKNGNVTGHLHRWRYRDGAGPKSDQGFLSDRSGG